MIIELSIIKNLSDSIKSTIRIFITLILFLLSYISYIKLNTRLKSKNNQKYIIYLIIMLAIVLGLQIPKDTMDVILYTTFVCIIAFLPLLFNKIYAIYTLPLILIINLISYLISSYAKLY